MDRRDAERFHERWYRSISVAGMFVTIPLDEDRAEELGEDPTLASSVMQDDDGESVLKCPIRYGVCGLCEGKGKHVDPSIDAHGLSSEDFDADPDFAESYFSGAYDVQCYRCDGQRVQPEIDTARLSAPLCKVVDRYFAGLAADRRERESEARYGY